MWYASSSPYKRSLSSVGFLVAHWRRCLSSLFFSFLHSDISSCSRAKLLSIVQSLLSLQIHRNTSIDVDQLILYERHTEEEEREEEKRSMISDRLRVLVQWGLTSVVVLLFLWGVCTAGAVASCGDSLLSRCWSHSLGLAKARLSGDKNNQSSSFSLSAPSFSLFLTLLSFFWKACFFSFFGNRWTGVFFPRQNRRDLETDWERFLFSFSSFESSAAPLNLSVS